jgi:putative SOS response-associated peptidase YedK
MCFTIEIHLSRKAIENRFSVDTSALYDFDFNYFYRAFANPMIPVVAQEAPERADLMQWGLIPSWTKDRQKAEQIRKGTYNARAESLHEKPSFRGPLQKGRCLVLAHGFFEWQHEKGVKIPWYIRLKNDAPFAFAGLYDNWCDHETGELVRSCSIVTTAANPLMEKIHNSRKRMPVILPKDLEKDWISGELSPGRVHQLLLAFPEEEMHAYRISSRISDPRVDPGDAEIIKPYDRPDSGMLF